MSRKAGARRKPAQYGFDYGLTANAAAMGSLDFNQNLIDAEVIAVAYGEDYSRELGAQVPVISLVARNEVPLRQAFEEFSYWAEATDGDAVDMTIVFLKSGAYRLCINPEVSALIKRALRYDAVMNTLAFQVTWIKHIDTTSEPLRQLREHLSKGVRPFLLRAACYGGIASPDSPPRPELIRPVSHRKEILKFDIRFIDEGSTNNLDWQRVALGKGKRKRSGKGKKSRKRRNRRENDPPPKAVVWWQREERLKTLFPVTLWRSRSRRDALELRAAAERSGLQSWQIDQALCNLVLSREAAGGKLHFLGWLKNDWPDKLLEILRERFEIADARGGGFKDLRPEDVIRQSMLDSKVLLREYGCKHIEEKLESIQRLLRTRALLTASSE